MGMQPSQKSFEAAKAALAHLGASADSARHLSLNAVAPIQEAATKAEAATAIKDAAKFALSGSILERGDFLAHAGQSRSASSAAESPQSRRTSLEFDKTWGAVEVTVLSPKAFLETWSQTDPKGFEAFSKQVDGMAKDLAALGKISPATAAIHADMAIFGNAKCSDAVRHAVEIQLKQAGSAVVPAKPQAPKA